MNSLDKLIPTSTSVVVTIEGKDITFNRIRVKHLSRFIPIVEQLSTAIAKDDQEALVNEHLGDIIEMIAMCTGKSIDECGDFPVECFEHALAAIFEVNKDFFVRAAMKVVAVKKQAELVL